MVTGKFIVPSDMAPTNPDQRLALAFSTTPFRNDFATLLAFDGVLGQAIRTVSEPALAQLRLAWWRDQLSDEAPPPSDPVLVAVRRLCSNGKVSAGGLAGVVNAWESMLQDEPLSDAALDDYAMERGVGLFAAAAQVAGQSLGAEGEHAAKLWAFVDYAKRKGDGEAAQRAIEQAREHAGFAKNLPPQLRPFAILTRFAERDIRQGLGNITPVGSPRRILDAWSLVLGFQ
jgi:15-cis-phytoene synthase